MGNSVHMIAHLRKAEDGTRQEQTLQEHCLHVAIYACDSMSGTGLEHAAYLAGLLHDMGKAKQAFVDYLESAFAGNSVVRGSVNHTFAGVIYLLDKFHGDDADRWERLTSEMLSCAIGGHHGIFDCVDLNGKNGFVHRLEKDRQEIGYEETLHNFFGEVTSESNIEELFRQSLEEIRNFFQNIKKQCEKDASGVWFQMALAVRLLQSVVIYADRRDTREFMQGDSVKTAEEADWDDQIASLERYLGKFSVDTWMNQVRAHISLQCRDAAERPCGIYRLDVPTGSGKTLATLRFALQHAKRYQKKRIIFIIPLLSVLDQNAEVIRASVRNPEMILEHHSNVIREQSKEAAEELDPYEIMTEDWHSPIIISTMVQFLNNLFSGKTSAIARMQALCDSVIVLDEVQSLPIKVTAMFNMAMNFLCECCHATIVLSSATQPSFDQLGNWSIRLAKHPELVSLDEEERAAFQRSEIIDATTPYGLSEEECADFCSDCICENASVLLICNTKREAREIFMRIFDRAEEGWEVFHLSTAMCQAHRKLILHEVRQQLTEVQQEGAGSGRKVICISTQLVEAGVDFSFECVIRIMAGIDNLAQAAGRCNRSNEYGHPGKVYLINLKNENLRMIPDITRAQDATRKVLTESAGVEGRKLIGAESSRNYYNAIFLYAGKETKYPFKEAGNTLYMADLLANSNEFAMHSALNGKFVFKQPFKVTGKKFQVFEEESTDVLVPFGEGEELIRQLREMPMGMISTSQFERLMKKAGQYTISIFANQKKALEENGLLESICGGRVFVLDAKAYHEDSYGLGDIKELEVEQFIL